MIRAQTHLPTARSEDRACEVPAFPSKTVKGVPPTVQRVRWIGSLTLGYLALLTAAEILTTRIPAWGVPVVYGTVLLLLLLHTVLYWNDRARVVPLILSAAPLARLALLLGEPAGLPVGFHWLAIGLPALAACAALPFVAGRVTEKTVPRNADGPVRTARGSHPRPGGESVPSSPAVLRHPLNWQGVFLRLWEHRRRRWTIRWPMRPVSEIASAAVAAVVEQGRGFLRACRTARWGHLLQRLQPPLPFRTMGASLCLWVRQGARIMEILRRPLPAPVVTIQPVVIVLLVLGGVWVTGSGEVSLAAAPKAGLRIAPAVDRGAALGVPMEHLVDPRYQRQDRLTWQRAASRVHRDAVEVAAEPTVSGPGPTGWQRVRPGLVIPPPREELRTILPPAAAYLTEEPAEILRLVEAERQAAPRTADPWPSPDELLAEHPACPFASYANLYPRGFCTWHAKELRPDLPSFVWDAGLADNWPWAAERCGFSVNIVPAVGAVIVYPSGANGAFPGGHVGYVVEVGADYLVSSECNTSQSRVRPGVSYWYEAGHLCTYRYLSLDRIDPRVRFIHRRDANAWLDSWEMPDELQ